MYLLYSMDLLKLNEFFKKIKEIKKIKKSNIEIWQTRASIINYHNKFIKKYPNLAVFAFDRIGVDISVHGIYEKEILEGLKDCILNHGNNDFPSTEEGKIFRLADKLSALDKDFVSFFLEHNKDKIEEEDLSFIKMFLDKSFGYLKEFNIKKD